MNKFKDVHVNGDEIVSKYQHIDNGGYFVTIDKFGTVYIEFSFYGYATTKLSLPEIDIDGLIALLQESKILLERENIMQKLKGEI